MAEMTLKYRLQNIFARAVLRAALLLPFRLRGQVVGQAMSRVVAPLAGWRRRIRENLALTCPDLPKDEVERIVRGVPVSMGKALIETYSGKEFVDLVKDTPVTGPGAVALDAAQEAGEPLMLLTGHVGNYEVLRARYYAKGYPLAVLYKPMRNKAFNEHYIAAMKAIGEPMFATDLRGISGLVRHLKGGNAVGIVADVATRQAPVLSFFGQPAHTSVAAAEWTVKYKARMFPLFGLRNDDGRSYRIHVGAEIPVTTPEEMMQAYNDELERVVRDNMDQWYWTHKRWKKRP